uniref:Uncharacterized protein n=1 Tax=Romanomermis culicivorax TaxID=13658 RepID=A0A915JI80_ROMCU
MIPIHSEYRRNQNTTMNTVLYYIRPRNQTFLALEAEQVTVAGLLTCEKKDSVPESHIDDIRQKVSRILFSKDDLNKEQVKVAISSTVQRILNICSAPHRISKQLVVKRTASFIALKTISGRT